MGSCPQVMIALFLLGPKHSQGCVGENDKAHHQESYRTAHLDSIIKGRSEGHAH